MTGKNRTSLLRHLGTIRPWRVLKRREIRHALRELEPLFIGCAYTPAFKEIVGARELLEQARKKMNCRNWTHGATAREQAAHDAAATQREHTDG